MTTAQSDRRNLEQLDLLEAVEEFGWRKLPFDCMRECGSATLTLAGLMREMKGSFFHRNATIAKQIEVPERTMKRHLKKLSDNGWLESEGRQASQNGRTRRTVTRRVSKRARTSPAFGVLPRYLDLWRNQFTGSLRWSEIAVYSVVIGRAFTLHRTFQHAEQPTEDLFDLSEFTDRFFFSLVELRQKTGLTRQAIIDAKWRLYELGLIELNQTCGSRDQLFPSIRTRIAQWDSDEGSMYCVEFTK